MDIKKLIGELRDKGISLWSEDRALKYKAPKGIMTDEIRDVLKNNKLGIIEYLNNKQVTFERNNAGRYNRFPLTDIQNSYVIGRNNLYELGGVACHGYLEVEFDEVIDPKGLEAAWNKVIQKHDMLRAVVYDVGYQLVQETVPYVSITSVDLRKDSMEGQKKKEMLRDSLANKQYRLGEWPLCDMAVCIEEEKSVVHFSVDMLVADFLSMNIILNDLEFFYRNPNTSINYPTLYRDVITYQNDWKILNPKERQIAEAYWDNKLPAIGEAPDLPVINKSGLTEHTFSQKKMFLDKGIWKEFRKTARNHSITPSALVMAALAEVVALWSLNDKFSINTTFFNRPQIVNDINQVVGDFTDVIVSSINLDYSIPFINRVRAIQNDLWLDLEHKVVSGVEILRKLTKERGKNIIMPVVFTSTVGIASEEDATVRRKIEYKISQTPQVYIDCQISDENGGAKINWDIRDGIFEEQIIRDMFESFTGLINAICNDAVNVFAELYPIRLSSKTNEVRNSINDTKKTFVSQMMEEGFLQSLRTYPNKTAIITDKGEFTYESFSKYVKTIVDLLSVNGVMPGDRIGINLDKNEWQIAAVIATLLMKGTYVPIDVNQPYVRKEKIIKAADIRVLLSEDVESKSYDSCININISTVSLSEEMLDAFAADNDYDRPAYIIFTSGTTGEPKGVIISHRAAMNTIIDVNDRYHIDESDVFLALANLSFDLSVYDVFGCFLAGGTLVLPDSKKMKDPQYIYGLIILNRISIWNSVPAQMQMVTGYFETMDHAKKNTTLSKVFLSGDWIPVSLPSRIHDMLPNALAVSMGGATEASIWSIYYDIDRNEIFNNSVPYGKPMASQKFYVLNKHLRPCPDYVEGDLYIAGAGLSLGYLNDDVLNAEKYVKLPETGERIYRTGDRGYYRNDGNIIFRGREAGDEQVKIHGHRIELAEIRSALTEYPAVDTAIALATGTPPDELRLSAVITPKRKMTKTGIIDDHTETEMLTMTGKSFEESIDGDLLERWTKKSEHVVISDIYNTFRKFGIFVDLHKQHYFDDIIQAVKIPAKLHKLAKRWLAVLVKEGIIEENNLTYALTSNNQNLDSAARWEEFYQIEDKFNYSKEFVDYLKTSSDLLPDMIQGNENPLNALFPKGDVTPAMAAYHDNKINQIQNGIACKEVVYLCKQSNEKYPEKTFRILEIGAGVGGTSIDLIPQLDGFNIEYHFTDLSTFFLNNAQQNFGRYDWVKYGLFDINTDFALQGYDSFSFDLILCANVLHNAKDIHYVMDNLKGMLVDNGTMIVLEETRISYMLLTSMEFKDGLTGFLDERMEDDQTFFTRTQWENNFNRHRGEIIFEFPGRDSKLDISGQTIYITRFPCEYEQLDKTKVQEFLFNTISSYMVPGNILVLPSMPLTDNKKIDMNKVQAYMKQNEKKSEVSISEKPWPETDLERRIAEIWCRELKIDSVGRDDNFYDIGGDSLLIAQVVGKTVEEIEEAQDWEWSALLTEMMQTPSVKEVASKIIKFHNERDTFIDPSLIQIKNSQVPNNESVAKVLFHAGTGTLSAYTDLLSYIEKNSKDNESILGFSFGNEAEYISMETKDTFKLLGKKYGKILKNMGYGNYILIGHCVGGVIALEAAELLRENGLCVSDVTLISATIQMQKEMTHYAELPDDIYERALETSLDNELLLERTFARLINANEYEAGYTTSDDDLEKCIEYLVKECDGVVSAEALCSLDGQYKDIGDNFTKLSQKPISERLNDLYATIERSESNLMEHERKMLNTLFNIFSQNFGCVATHQPRHYTGSVRLFSCEQQEGSFFREFFGENIETWLPYLEGEYTYDTIAGQHFDCIVEPNLSKNIGKILDFKCDTLNKA